ncbi:hypothetical protein [Phaeodactylibacter xiamenensis]
MNHSTNGSVTAHTHTHTIRRSQDAKEDTHRAPSDTSQHNHVGLEL